jgi:hypothetical protein
MAGELRGRDNHGVHSNGAKSFVKGLRRQAYAERSLLYCARPGCALLRMKAGIGISIVMRLKEVKSGPRL